MTWQPWVQFPLYLFEFDSWGFGAWILDCDLDSGLSISFSYPLWSEFSLFANFYHFPSHWTFYPSSPLFQESLWNPILFYVYKPNTNHAQVQGQFFTFKKSILNTKSLLSLIMFFTPSANLYHDKNSPFWKRRFAQISIQTKLSILNQWKCKWFYPYFIYYQTRIC